MGIRHTTSSAGRRLSRVNAVSPPPLSVLRVPNTSDSASHLPDGPIRSATNHSRAQAESHQSSESRGASRHKQVRLLRQNRPKAVEGDTRGASSPKIRGYKKTHSHHTVLKYKPIAGEDSEDESPGAQSGSAPLSPTRGGPVEKKSSGVSLFCPAAVRPVNIGNVCSIQKELMKRKVVVTAAADVFTVADESRTLDSNNNNAGLRPAVAPSHSSTALRPTMRVHTSDGRIVLTANAPKGKKTYGQLAKQLRSYQIVVSDSSTGPVPLLPKSPSKRAVTAAGASPIKACFSTSTSAGTSSSGKGRSMPKTPSSVVSLFEGGGTVAGNNSKGVNNFSTMTNNPPRDKRHACNSARHSPDNSVRCADRNLKLIKSCKRSYINLSHAIKQDDTPMQNRTFSKLPTPETAAVEMERVNSVPAVARKTSSTTAAGSSGEKPRTRKETASQFKRLADTSINMSKTPASHQHLTMVPKLMASKSCARLFKEKPTGTEESIALALNEKYKKKYEEQRLIARYEEKKKFGSDELSRAERKRRWAGENGKFDNLRLNSWYATMHPQYAKKKEE